MEGEVATVCHEVIWGSGAPLILNLVTRWRWVVSFVPWPLDPGESVFITHFTGGWLYPRDSLDASKNSKVSYLVHCIASMLTALSWLLMWLIQ